MGKIKFNKPTIITLVIVFLAIIIIVTPLDSILFFMALLSSLLYLNTCFVSYCTSLVEKKYDSEYDAFFRILFLIMSALFWTAYVCYVKF